MMEMGCAVIVSLEYGVGRQVLLQERGEASEVCPERGEFEDRFSGDRVETIAVFDVTTIEDVDIF